MTMKVRAGGALRTITGFKLKQAGVLRTIIRMRVMDGGVLRQVGLFTSPLSVSAGDIGVKGSGEGTLTTAFRTAFPQGGLSPFTYLWTLQSSSGTSPSTTSNPTSASTSFTKTNLPGVGSLTDTWRVTVTDSLGATAFTDLSVTFNNLPPGGPD